MALQAKTDYRPDIDGLRAIAVIAVVLYHLDIMPFSGGFVGVDVFFVISGFLITRILCREIDGGHFSIIRFYERRMRRIAPALFAVILASVVAGYFIFMPRELEGLGNSIRYTVLMAANIYWWKHLDYFSAPPDTKPMLHMWSLGVEEQFYLFFPLILLLIAWKVQKFRQSILWVMLIASFAACVMMMYNSMSTAFYWLPFRAWELLAGSVLIFLPNSKRLPSWSTHLLAILGFICLLIPIFVLDNTSSFPGMNALPPVLGTALLIWVGTGQQGWFSKLLSYRPVVYIGLISYSLYLWHWPMIVYARYWALESLTTIQTFVLAIGILGASILSYHFVEKPFRNKNNVSQKAIFRFTFCGVVVFLVTAIVFAKTEGLPQRLPKDVAHYLSQISKVPEMAGRCIGINMPFDIKDIKKCSLGDKEKEPTILVWGDSYAGTLATGLDEFLHAHDQSAVLLSTGGCLPVLGLGTFFEPGEKQCAALQSNILQVIDEWNIKTVILHASWLGLDVPSRFKWIKAPKKDTFMQTVQAAFDDTIAKLRERHVKIIIIDVGVVFDKNVPFEMARLALSRKEPVITFPLSAAKAKAEKVQSLFAHYQNSKDILLLDPKDVLCQNETCFGAENGIPLYWDDGHLNDEGSRAMMPLYEPMVDFLGWSQK